MARGTLVAESLRVGASLEGLNMTVTRAWRVPAPGAAPPVWTLIEFEVPDADAPRLLETLAECLNPHGGWYCDFRTDSESFVAFAGTTFRYPRGDRVGRSAAQDYARSRGVPESQLDWTE